MMAQGIMVENTAGSVIIDEKYFNLEFKGSYSATIPTSPNWLGITVTGTNPVIAIRNTGTNHVGLIGVRFISPNTWVFYVAKTNTNATTAPFTYYVFDTPSSTAPTGVGLIVRNSSNQIVFNSQKKYMRVAGVFTAKVPYDTPATSTINTGLDSSRTYAFAVIRPTTRRVYTAGDPTAEVWSVGFKNVTQNIEQSDIYIFDDTVLNSGSSAGNVVIMMLDVTNY